MKMGKRKIHTRTDVDGDLPMDSKPHTRDRVKKIRDRGNRDVKTSHSPVRSQLSSQIAQREILRQLGSTVKRREAPRRGIHEKRTHSFAPHVVTSYVDKRADTKTLIVSGWGKSKAASNEDGGVSDIIAFLERRATLNMAKWAASKGTTSGAPIKIKKYSVHDDALHISVTADEMPSLLRLDGYVFAGANIGVKSDVGREQMTSTQDQMIEPDYKQLLQQVLGKRYSPQKKLLDLSNLGKDPDLNAAGVFNAVKGQSKLFPALMKLCDNQFKSTEEKRETIQSVTLANNDLVSVSPVTTLAQTFPELQNLDLSNNSLNDLNSLLPWRHKFRQLKFLILSGNPLEKTSPDYVTDIMKWYRTLRMLNGTEIRSEDDIKQKEEEIPSVPLTILPPYFQDEGQIAETFVKNFFLGFDNDRSGLVSYYYDSDSQFSLSINTKALRDSSSSANLVLQKWDAYIKRSRNLRKVTQLPARLSRNYCGSEVIRDVFQSLPASRHPSLSDEPQKWLIECTPQPGIPDQSRQSDAGVGGFLITVHGEFTEVQQSHDTSSKMRSFDRTFVLGPGGPNGIRIVSEMWTLRAYGGFAMFRGEAANKNGQATEVERNSMVQELSRVTGMKLDFSRQCLEESGWSPERAAANFEAAKATLPSEIFLA